MLINVYINNSLMV